MERIILPLKSQPVCGHNPKPQMLGREEGLLVVTGKKGTYIRPYIYGICSECEKKDQEEMEKEVKEIEKEVK